MLKIRFQKQFKYKKAHLSSSHALRMTRRDRCAFYIALLILLSQTHYHNPRVFHHKEPTPIHIIKLITDT